MIFSLRKIMGSFRQLLWILTNPLSRLVPYQGIGISVFSLENQCSLRLQFEASSVDVTLRVVCPM